MEVLTERPKVLHSARGLLRFIFQADDVEDIRVKIRSIYPDHGEEFSLMYESISGSNVMEIHEFIKKLFREIISEAPASNFQDWSYYDFRLRLSYAYVHMSREENEEGEEVDIEIPYHFHAINNASPLGYEFYETYNCPVLLHRAFPGKNVLIKSYEGYPTGVSFMYHPAFQGELPPEPDPMILRLENRYDTQTVRAPIYSPTGIMTIDWGDGTREVIPPNPSMDPALLPTHTYNGTGEYIMTIDAGSQAIYDSRINGNTMSPFGRMIEELIKWSKNVLIVRFGLSALKIISDILPENCARGGIAPDVPIGTPSVGQSATFLFEQTALVEMPDDLFMLNPDIESFGNVFFACRSLVDIPENIFKYNTKAKNFTRVFSNCFALVTPPENVFRYNTQATSFEEAFSDCRKLISVPEGLFKYNVNVLSFRGVFSTCNELRGAALATNGLVSVPKDIFRYNTKVTDMRWVFGLSGIVAMDTWFAYNTEVTQFGASGSAQGVFERCFKLTSVRVDIFDNNKKVVDFGSAFKAEDSVSPTLTGPTPSTGGVKLWQRAGLPGYPAVVEGSQAFFGQTTLSDYGSIPANWSTI